MNHIIVGDLVVWRDTLHHMLLLLSLLLSLVVLSLLLLSTMSVRNLAVIVGIYYIGAYRSVALDTLKVQLCRGNLIYVKVI